MIGQVPNKPMHTVGMWDKDALTKSEQPCSSSIMTICTRMIYRAGLFSHLMECSDLSIRFSEISISGPPSSAPSTLIKIISHVHAKPG
jgi:hypothetical protein